MKRFLYGLAALPFLAGISLAGQPVPLSDKQMDAVTAGFDFIEETLTNTSEVLVAINHLPVISSDPGATAANPCNGECFLVINGVWFKPGPFPPPAEPQVRSFQVQAQFGP